MYSYIDTAYSGYAYAKAFLLRNQEALITPHVNAYNFSYTQLETVINKTYYEMAVRTLNLTIRDKLHTVKHKPFQKRTAARRRRSRKSGCSCNRFCNPITTKTAGETSKLNETTVNELHEMKLSVMAQSLPVQLTDQKFLDIAFEKRFGLLVDAEWTSRKNKRLTRLINGTRYVFPNAAIEYIE
jgi:hypothetical protein